MPRPEKVAVVEEIRTKLDGADAALLTEYRGLAVDELAALRGALRPSGTEYKVFKNTLARRAASAAGRDELLPMLEGPVAIAFVHGDAVVAAKALRDFARDHDALVLKGGLLGERLLVQADLEVLADIAPRDELLGRLAGGFQAPLVKAAGLFGAFTRTFAFGLQAYVDRRADEDGVPQTSPSQPEATQTEAAQTEAAQPEAADEDTAAAEAPAAGDDDTATGDEPAAQTETGE